MRLRTAPPPAAGKLDLELLWGALGAGILILLHFGLSPSLLSLACPFKLLTSLPCPSCGMTRAWEALARGDWALAFRMHPALSAGYFILWGYLPYALGAVAGLWPRLGIRMTQGEGLWIRLLLLASCAVLWVFLIWDGR